MDGVMDGNNIVVDIVVGVMDGVMDGNNIVVDIVVGVMDGNSEVVDVVAVATSLEVTEVISLVVDRVIVGVIVVPIHYWIEIYGIMIWYYDTL